MSFARKFRRHDVLHALVSEVHPTFDHAIFALEAWVTLRQDAGKTLLPFAAHLDVRSPSKTVLTIGRREFFRRALPDPEVRAALGHADPLDDLRLLVSRPGESGTILLSRALAEGTIQ